MCEWLSSFNTGLSGFINLMPLAKIICCLMRHHVGYENADFILMARIALRLDTFATAAHFYTTFVLAVIVVCYCCSKHSKVKGKAVPLQAWTGPEGSRKLKLPDFVTTAQDGGRLSALRTGRLYPQEILLVLIYRRG